MSDYKIQIYMICDEEGLVNAFPDCNIYRVRIISGQKELLRSGNYEPEPIVKTLKDAGVEAELYYITEEDLDKGHWYKAELVPEEEW